MSSKNQPTPREQWNSPIGDYDMLTDESCKLLFEQSKLYFEETVQESEELTQRGIRTLFLLLPAVAAVIGFCISNREKLKPVREFGVVLLITMALFLIFCLYHLFALIRPKTIHYRGSKPEEMMRPEIFSLKESVQIQKALYVSEIERYQVKIEQMEATNNKRIKTYSYVVYSFNAMAAIGIVLLTRSI